ncbi:MAG TPA: PilZ domain-containing protein [Gemmataceae bacterium]|jgi:hypothetical protein
MLKPLPRPPTQTNGFARPKDRRAAIRCSPFRMTPCYITSAAEGVAAAAWVHNLSSQGVGIVGGPWIAPGAVVQVEMINAGHTYVLALEMQVTRAEQASTGGHFLGGQFTRKLIYTELLPFLI